MKVCVLGCGAYGSALAKILCENKNEVVCYSRFEKEVKALIETRVSPKLPNVKLPLGIEFTNDLEKACDGASFILVAVPTAFVSDVLKKAKKYIVDKPICIASKGIEQDSHLFVSEIVENIVGTNNIAVFSGPSFAIDVANESPVGLTLACQHKETTDMIIKAFSNKHFKLRVTGDIIGTEICGAIKNVIAIAAGILSGMELPESTQAMFITESIHDIKELIKGLGADGDTITSFAGFGDLLLTCTSPKSRNFSFGYMIGKGSSQKEIDEYLSSTTVEGFYTLKSIKGLIEGKNVEMPIINLIEEIIYGEKKPKDLVNFLIRKP